MTVLGRNFSPKKDGVGLGGRNWDSLAPGKQGLWILIQNAKNNQQKLLKCCVTPVENSSSEAIFALKCVRKMGQFTTIYIDDPPWLNFRKWYRRCVWSIEIQTGIFWSKDLVMKKIHHPMNYSALLEACLFFLCSGIFHSFLWVT